MPEIIQLHRSAVTVEDSQDIFLVFRVLKTQHGGMWMVSPGKFPLMLGRHVALDFKTVPWLMQITFLLLLQGFPKNLQESDFKSPV